MQPLKIHVKEDSGERLDIYVTNIISNESRTYIKELIKNGYIKVNGNIVKPKYKVKYKDHIIINFPKPEIIKIKPENMKLDIIYEDENLAIINKPQGMVVHPAKDNYSGTLVNGLLYHFEHLSNYAGLMRPGIVHRLDKDTSGLLIVAKDNFSHERLSKALKARKINRKYYALVHGDVKEDKKTIIKPIGRNPNDRRKMEVVREHGKIAITHYKVLRRYKNYTLLEIELETGRTHQIRVHMAYIGHPVVGDRSYSDIGDKFGLKGQLLHAREISFVHPLNNCLMKFTSNLPDYFQEIVNLLNERVGEIS